MHLIILDTQTSHTDADHPRYFDGPLRPSTYALIIPDTLMGHSDESYRYYPSQTHPAIVTIII